MSVHGVNSIFSNKKIRIGCPEDSLIPNPTTSDKIWSLYYPSPFREDVICASPLKLKRKVFHSLNLSFPLLFSLLIISTVFLLLYLGCHLDILHCQRYSPHFHPDSPNSLDSYPDSTHFRLVSAFSRILIASLLAFLPWFSTVPSFDPQFPISAFTDSLLSL